MSSAAKLTSEEGGAALQQQVTAIMAALDMVTGVDSNQVVPSIIEPPSFPAMRV